MMKLKQDDKWDLTASREIKVWWQYFVPVCSIAYR